MQSVTRQEVMLIRYAHKFRAGAKEFETYTHVKKGVVDHDTESTVI